MITINGWRALGYNSYEEYLLGYIWLEKKSYFLKVFPKCEMCGKLASTVHHKTYERVGNEKKTDIMALCKECHNKIHNK